MDGMRKRRRPHCIYMDAGLGAGSDYFGCTEQAESYWEQIFEETKSQQGLLNFGIIVEEERKTTKVLDACVNDTF